MIKKYLSIMSGCYAPPNREVTLFKHLSLINQLPEGFLKILVTHTPVHQNCFKYVDMVLYDNNNVVDERAFSFGAAESMLIRQGLILSKYYGIEWMFKLGFDCLPNNIKEVYEWLKHIEKYKMITTEHGGKGVGSLSFLVNVDWGLENLPEFRTVDEMFQGQDGKHLEVAYGEHIIKLGKWSDIYFYKNINEMFKQSGNPIDYRDDCQGVKQDENLLKSFKS